MKTNSIETKQVPWQDTSTEQANAERQEARRKRTSRAVKLGVFAFWASVGGVVIEDVGGEVSPKGVRETMTKAYDSIQGYREQAKQRELEAKYFDTDDAVVAQYRENLHQVLEEEATYEGDQSPSTTVEIVLADGERLTRTVDDNPDTGYRYNVNAHPAEVALDSVHPALLAAADIKEIRIETLDGGVGEYRGEDGIIYVDEKYSSETAPANIASVIHHEVAHEIHDSMGNEVKYPELVDFEAENPPWWRYKSDYSENSVAYKDYDMHKNSDGITTRWYGTKSPVEDFADYVSVIFDDERAVGIDDQNVNYTNYLLDNNELVVDKTAAIMAILQKYQPGLGNVAFDQVENKFDDRY